MEFELISDTESGKVWMTEFNPAMAQCPACAEKRMHTAEEWANHPDAGKGRSKQ